MSKHVIQVLDYDETTRFVGKPVVRMDRENARVEVCHPLVTDPRDAMKYTNRDAAKVVAKNFKQALVTGVSLRVVQLKDAVASNAYAGTHAPRALVRLRCVVTSREGVRGRLTG